MLIIPLIIVGKGENDEDFKCENWGKWRMPKHYNHLEVELIMQALEDIEYGSLVITVHDSRITQVDKTVKSRFPLETKAALAKLIHLFLKKINMKIEYADRITEGSSFTVYPFGMRITGSLFLYTT
jgi:hypothetical protein